MAHVKAHTLPPELLTRLNVDSPSWLRIALFVGLHVAVGLVVAPSSALATLHALGVFCLGVWWAVSRPLVWSAYAGAYIVGSEVLWRMTEARVPWEFGKYALAFVLLVALVRSRRIRGPLLPLLYFVLLLPSVWLTMAAFPFGEARELISFNLSGPFALLVCAWFFSHLKFRPREVQTFFLGLIGPVVSILTVAVFGMLQRLARGSLVFHTESNSATSGGFGPNQVSSMLGLAALLCFFYLLIGRSGKLHKASIAGLMLAFALQSALTFSRSGLAMAIGGGVAACFFLLQRERTRRVILGMAAGLLLLLSFVVVPRLNTFTGEAFAERFSSLETTNRTAIAGEELQIWQEHPYLGLGPGRGTIYRSESMGTRIASHTEFTRVMAEHGILGFLAIVAFLVACWLNFLRMPGSRERALVAGVVAWGLLYLLVNAFRLAAPALLVGFSFAGLWMNDTWRMRAWIPKKRSEPLFLEHGDASR